MANIHGLHSVGDSIIKFLHSTYPDTDDGMPSCQFQLISSGELAEEPGDDTRLTLYIYRVTYNEHLRNSTMARINNQRGIPLSLDLHFMISIWSDSPVAEHTVCAWVMQQLHNHPILDVSSLTEDGGWQADEVIQIIPAELSNEDLMRIWDALAPNYRLSISYIARSVRIEPEALVESQPVVATRFNYSEKALEEVNDA